METVSETLVCDCQDCRHWEVIRDGKGMHLVCRTCGRMDQLSAFEPGPTADKAKWIERE